MTPLKIFFLHIGILLLRAIATRAEYTVLSMVHCVLQNYNTDKLAFCTKFAMISLRS